MSTSSITAPPARATPSSASSKRCADLVVEQVAEVAAAAHASFSAAPASASRRREARCGPRARGTEATRRRRCRPAARRDRASATAGRRPSRPISPNVGFRPTMPHAAAGILIDPPVSVPMVPSAMPAATLAADPPLDPPGDRDGSCGLRAGPNAESSFVVPNANSWRFVLPTITAPASRSADDHLASAAATCPSRTRDAAVVGVPATSKRSLTEMGTPWSGPRSRPAASSRSSIGGLLPRGLVHHEDEGIQPRVSALDPLQASRRRLRTR